MPTTKHRGSSSSVSSFFLPRSVHANKQRGEAEASVPIPVPVPNELPAAAAAAWKIRPLTPSGSSWVVHVKGFCPSPSRQTFREFWKKHPPEQHSLVLFGKSVKENRYSQMYSVEQQQPQQQPHQQQQQQQEQQQLDQQYLGANDEEPIQGGGDKHENNYNNDKTAATAAVPDATDGSNSGSGSGSYRYTYSGTSRLCLPCDPSRRDEKFMMDLCAAADRIATNLVLRARSGMGMGMGIPTDHPRAMIHKATATATPPTATATPPPPPPTPTPIYNCCLVNWYTPDHTIGLHSDDEHELDPDWPILSVSWGGPRWFLLRSKARAKNKTKTKGGGGSGSSSGSSNGSATGSATGSVFEFCLGDGDLLVMGGRCQEEFKHEVPRVRTTMDGVVGDRICWTLRRLLRRGTGNNGSRNNNYNNNNSNTSNSNKSKLHKPTPSSSSTTGNGNGNGNCNSNDNGNGNGNGNGKRKTQNDEQTINGRGRRRVLYNPYALKKPSS